MSLFKALQTYQSLTPDQKIFVQEKRIEGSYTPEQWLVFFSKIAEYDSLRDASKGKFTGLGCGYVALTVASVIVGFLTLYLLPLAFLLVIGMIFFFVFFSKWRKDVPNQLRQFIVPLLHILREEMKHKERMFLRVDLRGGTLAEKKYSDQLSPSAQRAQTHGSKIKEEYFANQWLAGSAKLADDTLLEWQIFERIRKREEGKKRTSGKYKTKTKHKIKTRVEASLIFKRQNYLIAKSGVKDDKNKVEIKSGANKDKINVRRVSVGAHLDAVTPLSELLEAITCGYRNVKPGQAGGNS
jgi:hypothetical protein